MLPARDHLPKLAGQRKALVARRRGVAADRGGRLRRARRWCLCGFGQLRAQPPAVVAEARTGFVTVVVCDDVVVVVAAGRGSTTVMVCGAADATAPVTGSFAFAVSVSVATG